ncbi:MAG: hypothetical protein A2140_06760 [Candidatus Muproteobacteria bacterium RBG_16_62_13]|uniref:Uncharacterized protein n=1 Tax=Candidatus Muproteobacteria bacterium RBG_16_62_13 TaxID=1817756 RepID=A0A1F6T350_9PROT|nr:MAG: hypothetical protein A2140_06760 [Candidatus Muproteobacteria bacterium RBG_16_62_13]
MGQDGSVVHIWADGGGDFQVGLFAQQGDADGVGAGADIQYPLAALDLDGRQETVAKPVPQAETRDVVRAVVIPGDVGKYVIQFLGPDLFELVLTHIFAH